jgi:hypothetical protein
MGRTYASSVPPKEMSIAITVVRTLTAALKDRGYKLTYDGNDWYISGNPQPYTLAGVRDWLNGGEVSS